MEQRICFFGDVHLGYGSAAEQQHRTTLLCEFLRALPGYYTHVVILGDLFDYWFDYRTVIPKGFWEVLAALAGLRRHGVTVDYVIGNHDFGHWRFFREELGIEPLGTDIERCWHGKRFYIAHGDGKIPGDWGYALLRSVLRNPLAQSLYRWLHPDVGISLARWVSHGSRRYAGPSAERLSYALESFAAERIRQGYDVVVLGHSHIPVLKPLETGWYANPGGWLVEDPLFVAFDGTQPQLCSVQRFLAAMG
jgi:UDP-2,3-diacylglucosamine hydrolase